MKKNNKLLFILFGLLFVFCGCNSLNSHTHEAIKTTIYNDENYHWYECSCHARMNYEKHTYDEGEVLVEANEYEDGVIDYTCTKCGYVHTVVIDHNTIEHVHNYKTLKYDSTSHWYECNCGDKNNVTEHEYTYNVINKATLDSNGTRTATCNICGYTCTQEYAITQLEMNEIADDLNSNISSLDQAGDIDEYDSVLSYIEIYNKLNVVAKEYVTNYTNLVNIQTSITIQINTIISNVEELIDDIKDITTISGADAAILAYTEYNKLNDYCKKKIENADVLESAYKMALVRKTIDVDNWTYEQGVEAVIAACESYINQGTRLQYDQYNSRRHYNANCDDANDYEYTYLDCSSFVNSVYYYLFNTNTTTSSNVDTAYFIQYANTNINNNIVTLCADSDTIGEKTEARASEIRAMLQPGDLYIYRHNDNSSGHVMLYVGTLSDGNDYFYHATGSAGDSTSLTYSNGPTTRTVENQSSHEKKYGTITLDKADIVFVESQGTKGTSGSINRYIFADDNDHWAIIRPLVRMTRSSIKASLSSNAVNKLMYGSSMNIVKTSTIQNHHSIAKDAINTYSLSITNQSNEDIDYIYVCENIPENASFVSCDSLGKNTNNKIEWQIEKIKANSTLTLTYELKANGSIGSIIDDNATYVNGLKFNDIAVNIKSNVSDKFSNISNYTTLSTLNAIREFYNDNYNVDLVNDLKICNEENTYSAKALLDDMLEFTSTKYYYTDCRINETSFSSLVPFGMYGGTRYRLEYEDDLDSIRNIKSQYLESGDIILVNYKTTYGIYYYASSSALYGDDESGLMTKLYSTSSTVDEFLHTIPYYFRFIIIRPSMSIKLNNK